MNKVYIIFSVLPTTEKPQARVFMLGNIKENKRGFKTGDLFSEDLLKIKNNPPVGTFSFNPKKYINLKTEKQLFKGRYKGSGGYVGNIVAQNEDSYYAVCQVLGEDLYNIPEKVQKNEK